MKRQISDAGKSDLFSQMHTLLDAGLDLSGTFGILVDECGNDTDRVMMESIYDDVLSGISLAESMERTGRFTVMDSSVIAVGEVSGRLPQTLSFLSGYYSSRDAHARMVRSSLSYPLMILGFAVVVLIFMVIVIVPVFGDIYARMGSELPGITRGMMALSEHAPLVLVCIGVVAAITAALYLRYKDTEAFDRFRSMVLMILPFVGAIVRTDCQYTFCRLMSLLTVSGVTMMNSLSLAGHSMRIRDYREAFMVIQEGVREGGTLAGTMAERLDLFEPRILSMIRVGEESNRLPEMFGKAADLFSGRLEECFKRLQTWLEPVMIVFVGLIVALVLVSMYLPMFRMGITLLGS